MFFKTTIKSRVMEAIMDRINGAQKDHEDHCTLIDKEAEEAKQAHFDTTVSRFVSKFM